MLGAAANQITLVFAGDATKLNRTFKEVGASSTNMSGKVASSSGGFRRMGAAAAAAGVAVGTLLFTIGRDSIKEFAAAETAQSKLQDAFARFPGLADTNINKLRALNETLAKKTRFDDDAFASGQAVLAQFKLTGRQLVDITPLLADYAAKTGQELPDAAGKLGKAFLGNTKALKELGINYKSTGDRAKDTAAITQLIREKVGGFADKEGKTAAGQAAILSNQFGELKETLGEKLLPVMLKLAEFGLKTIDWISKNKEIIIPLVTVIGVVTAAQWAWNVAMTANPIGLIIVGIALLVAGIVWLATKTTFFGDSWRFVWGMAKGVAMGLWNWIKGLPEKFGNVFSKIGKFITAPFRAAFNFIADAWNNTIGRLSWTVPGWVPFIGGNTISVPHLPKFHSGGVVPGAPGTEVVGLLQAGERVLRNGQGDGGRTVLELRSSGNRVDDLLMEILARAVGARGGNVQLAVMGR
jgi:hypothetical protein